MTLRQPRYGKEEFARRGDEIYDSHVRSLVEAGTHDLIVAIDIDRWKPSTVHLAVFILEKQSIS